VAAALEARSETLDLSYLYIKSLPDSISQLTSLTSLNCSTTLIVDLSPLSALPVLASLDCTFTQVIDLTPLSGLLTLASLDCSRSDVSDLSPLSGLPALSSLDCGFTLVSDLSPLSGLPALASLDCRSTKVNDLSPLAELPALISFDCSGTQVSDLSPLSELRVLVTLNCSTSQVCDLSPLSGLFALALLNCSDTLVRDLLPLAGLTSLTSLDCNRTNVRDLSPLAGLTTLTLLDCNATNVSDLSPLARLTALASLSCGQTQVSDLSPLSGLTELTKLLCYDTQVQDLSPLSSLTALAVLNCRDTLVSDLSPLSGLTELTRLLCYDTQVQDLSPLSSLTALALLNCRNTMVSDLSPLSGLMMLTELDCCGTQVSDLCLFRDLPLLSLIAAHLPNCPVPPEHLSQNYWDNCLPRLRAYWDNLDEGSEPLRKHKLFLLGNGTVGKTQLVRRLRGLEPDFDTPSTHGIQLHDCPLPAPPDPRHPLAGDSFDARIWDFGGQDIYHGTHALFLKSRAIFLVCWDSASVDAREHETGGETYRNYPLEYWLDYVRQFAGKGAQVILVQTKTDMPDAAIAPPVDLEAYADLAILEPCRTSALTGRGIGNLKEVISEAVGLIEAPALQLIGTSERMVADAVAARREAGERTLTQEQFAALCAEAGLAGAPEHLLHFLHHAGELFHAEGLFGDRIIIDQRWALEAIYAVFERQECAPLIRAERGRFTLAMLGETVWRGYSADEQRHFLAMMLHCGMAFEYIEGGAGREETIYIAPDLLPDFEDSAVQRWFLRDWDPGDPGRESVIRVPLLHDGLIRSLMVEVGKDAGLSAVYWKNGILFHDTRTRAVAMIAARWPDPEGWAGEIVITTQRSRAGELLAVLDQHVRGLAERLGLSLDEPGSPPDLPGISDDFGRTGRPRGAAAERGAFTPGPGEPRAPVCYVSYAWSDGTAQADANVARVDDLCAEAAAHGITIIRDRTHLATGDTISGFTEEIARADKVAALIGGRYWTRPDCFMELYGCWTESRSRPELFRAKVREFPLEDSRLYQSDLLREIADYWEAEFCRCDAMSAAHRDRHAALVAEFGDIWGRQSRQIIRAMQDTVRSYEGDFARFKQELFAEFDSLRYKPDHVQDT